MSLREIAHSIFIEALDKQRPSNIVFDSSSKYAELFSKAKKIFPVAFGKASPLMMDGLLNFLSKGYSEKIQKKPLVICNPQEVNTENEFDRIVSSHPTPDENSVLASKTVLDYVNKSGQDDLVVFLISGGGSSLLSYPIEGVTLSDKIQLTNLLLSTGCNINEINTIRKHISKIKGGKLNQAALPSKSLSMIISDVINDDISCIASGPTVADLSTFSDAVDIMNKYKIFEKAPDSIVKHLKLGCDGLVDETPKEFDNNTCEIISSNKVFKNSLAEIAKMNNFNVIKLDEPYTAYSIDDAKKLYKYAKNLGKKNTAIISGGETLVDLKGSGVGGRNQEFALSFLKSYVDDPCENDICLYSAGTDGIDGPTDAAGAIVDKHTFNMLDKTRTNIDQYLDDNDSYNFFNINESLIKIGATGTNVADIQIVLIS